MKKIRVVFMGTPNFSVPVLEGLIENYEVVLVVTQPDKCVGRHKEIKFSPIKELALKKKIPIFQPAKIKTDYQEILNTKADIIITCAYGQIIPKEILEFPQYGCINVHASLLPKLRGGAPIHKAIINNYPRTGITIMYMVEKMDAGDIISQKETVIKPDDNLESLHDRLSLMGKDLLLKTIPDIINKNIKPIKQDENEVTYAYNITREEEHLNFNESSIDIYNRIRGLSPTPGAFAYIDNKIIKIYKAELSDSFFTTKENGEISKIYKDGLGVSTKDREIIIKEFQFEGKKRMTVKEYLNGKTGDELLGKVLK